MLGFLFGGGDGSVSYTHLDVYKRQLEYVPKHLKTDRLCGMALEREPLAIRFFNPEQLTPCLLYTSRCV